MGLLMSSKSLYIDQNLLAFTWPYPRLLGRMALHTPKNFSPSHNETRSNYIYSKILEVWEGGGLSRQNSAHLKCSVARGKKKRKTILGTNTYFHILLATCWSIFEKSACGMMIPLKKRYYYYNCAQ